MTDSYVQISKGATSYVVGPDAIELFRAATLKSALGLLDKGIIPRRGLTKTKALAMVGRYTGKTYKRAQIAIAIADLQTWIEAMKAAIPMISKD